MSIPAAPFRRVLRAEIEIGAPRQTVSRLSLRATLRLPSPTRARRPPLDRVTRHYQLADGYSSSWWHVSADDFRETACVMAFRDTIETVGKGVDAAGVVVMIGGVLVAVSLAARRHRHYPAESTYRALRQALGKAILLGLELLVAADIIRTVAVSPTFESAGVLAIVVVIRTFLSFSLEVELEGRWPWQRGGGEPERTSERPS